MNDVSNTPPVTEKPSRLADTLREATQSLHTRAERTGLINEVLRGQTSRGEYALFLRNILPAYEALELGLEHHRNRLEIGLLAQPAVYRAAALTADLTALSGPEWRNVLPLVPAGRAYAARIAEVAARDPVRLIAHAYVRYLGDLNGGQILKRLLARALDLEPTMLGFYDFAEIGDLPSFRAIYRNAFDSAGDQIADLAPLREEAVLAFELNIGLSDALKTGVPAGS